MQLSHIKKRGASIGERHYRTSMGRVRQIQIMCLTCGDGACGAARRVRGGGQRPRLGGAAVVLAEVAPPRLLQSVPCTDHRGEGIGDVQDDVFW